ncbi:hypothetical protein D3872_20365 [Massilia cavernae]|uniref:Uncharacterized protein n=1 Tax=Massilia cavernae TaxID=2320864 RepID=A0A418XFU3_9BURK|nr:hypothetical protein D3872_20365 [Massilia cavernae]
MSSPKFQFNARQLILMIKVLPLPQESFMSKSKDHSASPTAGQRVDRNYKADQANPNRGTPGTNKAYDHVHGNRGGQLNPNRRSG